MSSIIEHVEIGAPVRTVYNQWTQFEAFPQFMDAVKEVEQLTPTRLRWTVQIGPRKTSFVTDITEQRPDERVAWNTQGGPRHAGVITFHRLADDQTRVTAQIEVEPQGWGENIADKTGLLAHLIRLDMENFKTFVQSAGSETGAWRNTIAQA